MSILIQSLVKGYDSYTYEDKTEYRQNINKENNFTLLCREISDHIPTESMQIINIVSLGSCVYTNRGHAHKVRMCIQGHN